MMQMACMAAHCAGSTTLVAEQFRRGSPPGNGHDIQKRRRLVFVSQERTKHKIQHLAPEKVCIFAKKPLSFYLLQIFIVFFFLPRCVQQDKRSRSLCKTRSLSAVAKQVD
jgi:hypothetical protein